MIGDEAIAGIPIASDAEEDTSFPRLSRIMSGGTSNSRPAQVAILGIDMIWDGNNTDWDYIIWDDGNVIAWR